MCKKCKHRRGCKKRGRVKKWVKIMVIKTGIKDMLQQTAQTSMTEIEREGAKAIVDCIF